MRSQTGANPLTVAFAAFIVTSALFCSSAIAQDEAAIQHDLAGRVLLPDGKAASKAVVHLMTRPADRAKRTVRSVTANQNGEFHFDDLIEGNYWLVGTSKGMASRIEQNKGIAVSPGDQSIVLQLANAPSLQVTVKSRADNKPISGASVRLPYSDIQQEYVTDKNGEVTIHGLTHQMWQVKVQAHRYANQAFSMNLEATNFGHVSASLEPGASLTGVVRNKAGDPVSNAGVSVFANSNMLKQTGFVRTDENGVYRFDCLPLTEMRRNVRVEGYKFSSVKFVMTVEAGGLQTHDVTLTPVATVKHAIRGRVMDVDGDAIEGAKIAVQRRRSSQVESDSAGNFKLTIFGNSARLVLQAKGFSPLHVSVTGKVTDPPAETEFRLMPGHTINGKTVDEQGKPLPDVRIVNDGLAGTGWGVYEVIKSDENGNFSFDSLPEKAVLDFSKPGYSPITDKLLPLGGDDEVIVTIPDAGMLRGRVVDNTTGTPIRDFTVRMISSPDRKRDEPHGHLFAEQVDGEFFSHITGRFEIKDLVQKMPLQVTVTADGYERKIIRRVVATKASEIETTIFRLNPIDMSRILSINGKLIDASGQGVPGVNMRLIAQTPSNPGEHSVSPITWDRINRGSVHLKASVQQFLSITTSKDGSFSFSNVDANNQLEIVYWGRGVVRGRLKKIEDYSAEKQQALVIRSAAGGNVKGKIDIESFGGVSKIAFRGGAKGYFYADVSGKSSTYEINDLPPGEYEILVSKSVPPKSTGYWQSIMVHSEKCHVESGQSLELDLKAR